jgi:hypothetical protein
VEYSLPQSNEKQPLDPLLLNNQASACPGFSVFRCVGSSKAEIRIELKVAEIRESEGIVYWADKFLEVSRNYHMVGELQSLECILKESSQRSSPGFLRAAGTAAY